MKDWRRRRTLAHNTLAANPSPELREQISQVAWEVGYAMDRIISTVVATRTDLDEGPLGASPLILSIEREGVRP